MALKKGKKPLGIYIHVPFCKSKCAYCDFYSLPDQSNRTVNQYVKAIREHIEEAGQLAPEYTVDTVYFGGGTPSWLGGEVLTAIMATIRKSFDVADDAEITCECNPDSVNDRLLRKLHGEGFNRISLGVQSDDNEMLKRLGRPHTFEDAMEAVDRIRKKHFKNISVDLMYGLPGQTLEQWSATLEHVLGVMKPQHISCYALTLEENTPMWELRRSPEIPNEDTQADMYLEMVRVLRNYGYAQYEISNFCRRGFHSRHNLRYWEGKEYIGFGPDASSDFGGKRYKCIRSLPDYISGILQGGTVLTEIQDMYPRDRAVEYLMLQLRTTAGIDPAFYEQTFRLSFAPIERYLLQCRDRGHAMLKSDGKWRLTPEGFLVANAIISDIMLIQEKSESLGGY